MEHPRSGAFTQGYAPFSLTHAHARSDILQAERPTFRPVPEAWPRPHGTTHRASPKGPCALLAHPQDTRLAYPTISTFSLSPTRRRALGEQPGHPPRSPLHHHDLCPPTVGQQHRPGEGPAGSWGEGEGPQTGKHHPLRLPQGPQAWPWLSPPQAPSLRSDKFSWFTGTP